MKKLLVTIAEENYLHFSKQLFISSIINGGWDGDLMLLTTKKVNDNELNWYYKNGIIVKKYDYFHNERSWYSSLPIGVKSPIVSLKLYLFGEEFKIWDKIVYLDSDIIIRASLDKLSDVRTFCAVKSHSAPIVGSTIIFSKKPGEIALKDRLNKKYDLSKPAFNAGVFAINNDCVPENIIDNYIILFNEYSKILKHSEQSILNLLFIDKWGELPFHYNYYVNLNVDVYRINPNKIYVTVLHFNGKKNPWLPDSLFHDEWEYIYNLTDEFVFKGNHIPKELQPIGLLFFKIYNYIKRINPKNIRYHIYWLLVNYFPSVYYRLKDKRSGL